MKTRTISRRALLAAGACALPVAAGMPQVATAAAASGLSAQNEDVIRRWYAAWGQKEWGPLDALLADDFTFSSAAGDDHMSRSDYKTQCWASQIGFTDRFDLLNVFGSGDEALVRYVLRTANGKEIQNVEYLRLRDGKLVFLDCYFGQASSFPSAVSVK